MITSFDSNKSRSAFTLSQGWARNGLITEMQQVVSVLHRIGNAQLYFVDTGSAWSMQGIGPMNCPAGSPPAIDPVFLKATVKMTWDDGNVATAVAIYDQFYYEVGLTDTYSWKSTATGTDIFRPSEWFLNGGGFSAGLDTPSNTAFDNYDTGAYSRLATNSVTNNTIVGGAMICTGQVTFAASTTGGVTTHGLIIDYKLENPVDYDSYVIIATQALEGATLLDAATDPSKNYSGYFLRFPSEFRPYFSVPGGLPTLTATNVVACCRARAGFIYQVQHGYSSGGTYAEWMKVYVSGASINYGPSPWQSTVGLGYNPIGGGPFPWDIAIAPFVTYGMPSDYLPLALDSLDKLVRPCVPGTPPTPGNNIPVVVAVKSAVRTAPHLSSLVCWTYDPGSNAWTSGTFTPGDPATIPGQYIFDPVTLLGGSAPSGYTVNPAPGSFAVAALTPFGGSTYGFAWGSF